MVASGKHPLDFLRKIYPYQILNSTHLAYKVGSQSLREWIGESKLNGTLEIFSEDLWLWLIPDDRLNEVRNTLVENNLLTIYLHDINRILEDYGKSQ